MLSRWVSRRAVALAAMVLIVLSPLACGLIAGVSDLEISTSTTGTGGSCSSDADCDDGNLCTTAHCNLSSGVCDASSEVPDGILPAELQTAGDCKTLRCKTGELISEDDGNDVLSDGNDCTVDHCVSGSAVHDPKPDDTTCLNSKAVGSCKAGECVVECGPGKPACDDKEPCTTDACDGESGKCTFLPLAEGAGTPGSSDVPGDCKVDVCVGGKAQIVADNSDTPSASNDCQQGTCIAGVPMPMFFAKNTTCASSGGQFCDGAGSCVKCNDNAQCGTNDDCNTFTCDAHVCNDTFTAVNTAIAAQVPFDCQKIVCDGAGKTKSIADNADLPDDSNDCTSDLCMAGVPSHTNLPFGMMCGNNSTCNLIGQCGCTDNSQCLSPQTCGGGNPGTPNLCGCTKATCASLGKSCGTFPDGCGLGGTINCDDATKNGGETDVDCGGASCSQKCGQGKVCVVSSDCSGGNCVDGRCCDSACNGACQACNLPGSLGVCSSVTSGTDNNPANVCNGNNACDPTGACKKINGQVCAGNADCVSGSCADGVCCNVACTGTCLACNLVGKVGLCSNIAQGAVDNNATVQCNGTNSCDGTGVCKVNDGQNCAVGSACVHGNCVDGVCCNNGCGTTCQACNVIGSVGTCTNLPSGQVDNSPANACNGNNACNGGNGAGACKKILAQPCAVGSECVSGSCADNVCCSSACNTACRACNVAGSVGTCTNLTSGTDNSPLNICAAPNSCDAAGNCKKVNGMACVGNAECISGNCVDNFCCGTASCPTCKACTGAAGTCVNLALNTQDNVPANACTGNSACDGSGNCKSKIGQGCLQNSTCLSGSCADLLCCDLACSGQCQACSALKKGAGVDGFCGNIANNTDPDLECVGTACNGAGACIPKAPTGTMCMNNNQCVSGFCTDGVCCVNACAGTCKTCNLPGNPGACLNVPLDQTDDAPVCGGAADPTHLCDGSAGCLLVTGQACNGNLDCVHHNCVANVCQP